MNMGLIACENAIYLTTSHQLLYLIKAYLQKVIYLNALLSKN